jgi:hypothetical protein
MKTALGTGFVTLSALMWSFVFVDAGCETLRTKTHNIAFDEVRHPFMSLVCPAIDVVQYEWFGILFPIQQDFTFPSSPAIVNT